MLPRRGDDEDIQEPHKGTNMGELDDCYDGCPGKNCRRGTVCRPRSLGVMSLGDDQRRRKAEGRRLPFRGYTGSR